MRMDAGVDTGPLISQRATAIEPEETAASLAERLARLGADLLVDTLPGYLSGELAPQPQDETLATYAADVEKRRRRAGFYAQRGGAGAQSARFPALAGRLYHLAGWTAESTAGSALSSTHRKRRVSPPESTPFTRVCQPSARRRACWCWKSCNQPERNPWQAKHSYKELGIGFETDRIYLHNAYRCSPIRLK